MRRAHAVLSVLVAAQMAVQAMAFACFVAGLYRWMESEGRLGVAHRSRLRSYDFTAPGELDKLVLRSAERWLDFGPALAVQRVTALLIGPALTLALVLVTLLLRDRAELARTGVIAAGVALQALPGLPAILWLPASFAILGAALLRTRPRHWAPALVAGATAGTTLALAAMVDWAGGYVTDGRGGTIWPGMMAQASGLPELWAVLQYLLLPLLALLAVAVRRDRTTLLLLAAAVAHAALSVFAAATPLLAAAYIALTYTVLIVAWGGPRSAS